MWKKYEYTDVEVFIKAGFFLCWTLKTELTEDQKTQSRKHHGQIE